VGVGGGGVVLKACSHNKQVETDGTPETNKTNETHETHETTSKQIVIQKHH
jgi:hypothetical protein